MLGNDRSLHSGKNLNAQVVSEILENVLRRILDAQVLSEIRENVLRRTRFAVFGDKWWWRRTSDSLIWRPLSVEEVIELVRLGHPQFPRLYVLSPTYEAALQFANEKDIPRYRFRVLSVARDAEDALRGLWLPTIVQLPGWEEKWGRDERLVQFATRRRAIIYRMHEPAQVHTPKFGL